MFFKKKVEKEVEKKIEAIHPTNREILILFFESNFGSWSDESLAWLGEKAAAMMLSNKSLYIKKALLLRNYEKINTNNDSDGVWYTLSPINVALRLTRNGELYVDG